MNTPWTTFCIGIALLVGVAACGADQPGRVRSPEPQHLTPSERAAAASGYAAIRSYCRRLGLHLAGRRAAPEQGLERQAIAGARRIALVARRKPEAPYTRVQTARELAADTAEDLEGTNCSARLVAELARGL